MALNPDRIDQAFHDSLRRHYTDEEIVELGGFIGFNIGYHTFFGSLKFYPMFAPDGRLVSQEESARLYGDVPVSLQAPAAPQPAAGESGGREARGEPSSPPQRRGAARNSESEQRPAQPGGASIKPLRPEDIGDAGLHALIEQCKALGVPDASFPRILARVPDHAKALLRALLFSHTEGDVPHRLKEVIRVRLARAAGDPYFSRLRSRRAQADGLDEATIGAGCGKFETDARFSDAEKWALRYARDLYLDPEKVDAAFYAEGKRHYSEAQIMELGAFIAFHYGMQAYARTLRLAAS